LRKGIKRKNQPERRPSAAIGWIDLVRLSSKRYQYALINLSLLSCSLKPILPDAEEEPRRYN
jgi:hypothetical protein